MLSAVYIEDEVAAHPRTAAILARVPASVPRIRCERYGEVFNLPAQNFRLQKQKPALILARKHGEMVLPTPPGYGIGLARNFYFSHMLNCPYDCRYCFLQGMYRSAHYVVFVNFEDFFAQISALATEEACFFSGYDADSLAFDGLTHFVDAALPFVRGLPQAWLELRSKSVAVKGLLAHEPWPRCVLAFSLAPAPLAAALEHGAPSLDARLTALAKVAERGWKIGLRFDPLIDCADFTTLYRELFDQVASRLPQAAIHSISLGPFRLPTGFFRRLEKLYPDDRLIAGSHLVERQGQISYSSERETAMVEFCETELVRRFGRDRIFRCAVTEPALAEVA
jgi:spore photoproduct lyase